METMTSTPKPSNLAAVTLPSGTFWGAVVALKKDTIVFDGEVFQMNFFFVVIPDVGRGWVNETLVRGYFN